jgi:catechol 2,3-dioxygenase-like lactoylglutathione lyase family enzyme
MAITRVHHHTFTVSNMDRSLTFYRDQLGFTLMYDKVRENLPAYDKVMQLADVKLRVVLLSDPTDEAIIALLEYHHPQPTVREMSNSFVGSSALAVQTDDIDADYARLLEAGVPFTSEPVDVVRDGKIAARLVYALDPDNIAIELYQPATD